MRTEITPGRTSDRLGFDLVMADSGGDDTVAKARAILQRQRAAG